MIASRIAHCPSFLRPHNPVLSIMFSTVTDVFACRAGDTW
jgi:hypothetical protein